MHPWERANLGTAPYRLLRCERVVYQSHPSAPVQPGGSCDYCGQAITIHCFIQSADGKTFRVGTDCVRRCDSGALATSVDRASRAVMRRAKAAREAARIADARARLTEHPALLTTAAHPNSTLAAKGRTMRDYVMWLFAHAGAAGKRRGARIVDAASAR